MTLANRRFWHKSLMAGSMLLLLGSLSSLVLVGCPSAGVGDPCIPEDEYRENFAGFKLTEENIESRSFQCQTRICLVNHFQGRVSCPGGQGAATVCASDAECTVPGEKCVASGAIVSDCDPTPCGEAGADPHNCNGGDARNPACSNRVCNEKGRYCECENQADCPQGYICDPGFHQCTIKVCSKSGDPANHCYVPGTDIPVTVPICAQCSTDSKRDAENAVYCSCRCDVAEGEDKDPNFNFCECPDGYSCTEIRKNVGLGDEQITGKYCIKQDTAYVDETRCGQVQGHWDIQCKGTAP